MTAAWVQVRLSHLVVISFTLDILHLVLVLVLVVLSSHAFCSEKVLPVQEILVLKVLALFLDLVIRRSNFNVEWFRIAEEIIFSDDFHLFTLNF